MKRVAGDRIRTVTAIQARFAPRDAWHRTSDSGLAGLPAIPVGRRAVYWAERL